MKANACSLEEKDDSVILSNGLCRILWSRTSEGWTARFQLKAEDAWHTLALDGHPGGAPYEVIEQRYDPDDDVYGAGEFRDKFKAALSWRSGRLGEGLPVRICKGFPPVTSRPEVTRLSSQEIQIAWQFPLTDGDTEAWQIEASFRDFSVDIERYKCKK